jgi:hypothetical protein
MAVLDSMFVPAAGPVVLPGCSAKATPLANSNAIMPSVRDIRTAISFSFLIATGERHHWTLVASRVQIDRKSQRHAFGVAARQRLVLGQVKVNEKSNEIVAPTKLYGNG